METRYLTEGDTITAVLTGAGTNPEKVFRFASPLPPYSSRDRVHISKPVITKSSLNLKDLAEGVAVRITVKSSTDKHGNPSWTATSLEIDSNLDTFSYVGRVDSGGIQHLRNDRVAWFLDDVYPSLPSDVAKCVVYKRSLSPAGRKAESQIDSGSLLIFNLQGKQVVYAELFAPNKLSSEFLVSYLAKLSEDPSFSGIFSNRVVDKDVSAILTTLSKRIDVGWEQVSWHDISIETIDDAILTLSQQGKLHEVKNNLPADLINAVFRTLPSCDAINFFPDSDFAWKYLESANAIFERELEKGASFLSLLSKAKQHDATEDFWRGLSDKHQDAISEAAQSLPSFTVLKTALSDGELSCLFENYHVDELQPVQYLIPYLPEKIVSELLTELFIDSFVPDENLMSLIANRYHRSSARLPIEIVQWIPELWRSGNLLNVITALDRRFNANSEAPRVLNLIARAIGDYINHNILDFNDPDRWSDKPSEAVGYILDLVGRNPSIGAELDGMNAFGYWDASISFVGPSKVWLALSNLDESWPSLDANEKIMAIHYQLKHHSSDLSAIPAGPNTHALVNAYLALINGAKTGNGAEAAAQAHELIMEAVLRQIPAPGSKVVISEAELMIDYGRALPRCSNSTISGVIYCEGNHVTKPSMTDYRKHMSNPNIYPKPTAELIYPEERKNVECHCHRLERASGGYKNSGCEVETGDGNGCARLYECRDLPWPHWTILEVLATLGYEPNLIQYFSESGRKPRLQTARINHNEYVNKVAAVVNRIDDLRDRLRCGWRDGSIDHSVGCGKPLTPSFSYRVFPAAYGITVMGGCSSSDDGVHDKNAYFNHCKRCVTILDSRESPIKDDSRLNTYICSSCGGWGDDAPGEFLKCGKCGSYHSWLNENNKSVSCEDCGHSWNPPNKYWAQVIQSARYRRT